MVKLKSGSIMKIDQRRASKDIVQSLKKSASDKVKIISAGKIGKKLTGFLRSDVLKVN